MGAVRSRRSWALGGCASGEVGGLDQLGFILGAEATCSRGLWPDTEATNTATPNFHFFFFFMLRMPSVGAASSTVSHSAFACVCVCVCVREAVITTSVDLFSPTP